MNATIVQEVVAFFVSAGLNKGEVSCFIGHLMIHLFNSIALAQRFVVLVFAGLLWRNTNRANRQNRMLYFSHFYLVCCTPVLIHYNTDC